MVCFVISEFNMVNMTDKERLLVRAVAKHKQES